MINTAEMQNLMKRCGYTPGEMAIELSTRDRRISEREIRDIVTGRCIPSWEHLVQIANMLGVRPLQLIKSERRNHDGENDK